MKILKKIGSALAFPFKHNKVWAIVTSILLVFFLVVSLVVTQVTLINNTFNTIFGEERRVLVSGDPSTAQYYKPSEGIDSKQKALDAADALNEELCEEGFVLLKNDGALPLSSNAKVSVFGMNSVDLVYGGSGSSAKDNSNGVDIYKSLENAGIAYNPDLKAFYERKKGEGFGRSTNLNFDTGYLQGLETGELPYTEYSGGVSQYANGYSDAALVVISRMGGEGWDLPRTMIGVEGANAQDHYLQLDNYERALIEALCADDSGYENVILIINCATSMELGFLKNNEFGPKLKGAIWVGTTGGTGMNALGKILVGQVNPSGRLVDTYAANFESAPSWYNFSNNLADGGNRYLVNGAAQNAYFVEYEEGIYVGYRYYETRGYTDGQDWYNQNVVYPFGYGLSYTDFTWTLKSIKLGDGGLEGASLGQGDAEKTITAEVEVLNNGDYAGKDVVQLYYSAPYIDGQIEKSHVVLGAFAKTPLIPAGESRTVTLEFAVRDMASYDYSYANDNDYAVYEADEGAYTVYIGKNAHCWADEDGISVNFEVEEPLIYDKDSATDTTIVNRFDNVSEHITTYLSRADWDGTFPKAPTEEERNVSQELIDSMSVEAYIGSGSNQDVGKKWFSERRPRPVRQELTYDQTTVKLYDLIGVDYEDELWDELLGQLTTDQMRYLIGTGNFNTAAIINIDKPKTIDPDGPAGFTQFMSVIEATDVVYDTCFYASECVIGATWNVELAEKMGIAIGDEGLIGNERGDGRTYSGWYAPAVNIHRSPFGGRNWEYYSEDGLLSGKMAAGVIQGAKSRGVYTYVKHFAINDQETDRDNFGLITWLNEQSMREIYLKPFELAVKEGKTTAMMSSFNRIGTVWAGGCYELLTEILRDEWGFRGMVITDYANSYMNPDQMIRAGGDLELFQDQQPSARGNSTHFTALYNATKNILYTVANSNAMNGMGEGIIYRYALPYWKIVLILIDVVVVVACAVWGFFAIRKSYKKVKAQSSESEQL